MDNSKTETRSQKNVSFLQQCGGIVTLREMGEFEEIPLQMGPYSPC